MHHLKGGPMRRLSQKLRRGAILIYPMGGDDTAFRIRVTVLPDTFAVSSLSVYRIFLLNARENREFSYKNWHLC